MKRKVKDKKQFILVMEHLPEFHLYTSLKESQKKYVQEITKEMFPESHPEHKMNYNSAFVSFEHLPAFWRKTVEKDWLMFIVEKIEDAKEVEKRKGENIFDQDTLTSKMWNFWHPLAEKIIDGVVYKVCEGYIRNKKKTYILYQASTIIAEFKSVQEAKDYADKTYGDKKKPG